MQSNRNLVVMVSHRWRLLDHCPYNGTKLRDSGRWHKFARSGSSISSLDSQRGYIPVKQFSIAKKNRPKSFVLSMLWGLVHLPGNIDYFDFPVLNNIYILLSYFSSMGILATAAFIYNLPLVAKCIDKSISVGFENLKSTTSFQKILNEFGLRKPENDFQSLYVHTIFLFASKGNKPKELIDLLFLKSCQEAFEREFKHQDKGAFRRELHDMLHTSPTIREIKSWNEIPQELVDEFFEIFHNSVHQIALPTDSLIINKLSDVKENLADKQWITEQLNAFKKDLLSSKVDIASTDSNDPLQKEYDRQLNTILKRMNVGRYQQSLEELSTLKSDIWANADKTVKFKILTNIGVCLFELGRRKDAAQTLIEAYEFDYESITSISNITNSYYILDDKVNGKKYLKIMLDRFGETSASAWATSITLSSDDRGLDELISEIPEKFLDKPIVLQSIGMVYRKKDDTPTATEYLKKAYEIEPNDVSTTEKYIKLLLEKYNFNFKVLNQRIIDDDDVEYINKVLDLLGKYYDLIKDSDLKDEIAFVFLSKGLLQSFLGENEKALNALDRGLEINPGDANLLKQKALVYAFSGEPAKTLAELLKISDLDSLPDGKVLLGEAYRHSGQLEKAIQIFEEELIKEDDAYFVRQSTEILVSLYIEAGCSEKLAKLKELGLDKNDILNCISLSRIARYEGNDEEANELLLFAKSRIEDSTRYKEIFFLAEEFEKADLFQDAIDLLNIITNRDTPSRLTAQLYRLNYRTGNKAEALAILSNLREKNGPLFPETKTEISIYQEYNDYDKARDVAEQYHKAFPDDIFVSLTLCGLNIRAGKFQQVDDFLDSDFDYLNLTSKGLGVYLTQLIDRGRYDKALKVAYQFRRKYRDAKSNDLYLSLFTQYPLLFKAIPTVEKISQDCVVFLSSKLVKNFHLTIEDLPLEKLLEGEINLDDKKFHALQGKNSGIEVVFPAENLNNKWKIESFMHKYLFAFREAQEKANTVFQDQSSFKVFHVDDFWEVMDSIGDKDWGPRYAQLMDFYKNKKAGIGFLSEMLSRNPIAMFRELQLNQQTGIQSTLGVEHETIESMEPLKRSSTLCLDTSALITVFELGLGDILTSKFGKILITTSTEDVFFQYKSDAMQFNEEGVLPQSVTDLLFFIERFCDSTAPDIISMNSAEKEQMDRVIGKSFADTILLAKQKNGIIYTEDYVTRIVSLEKFGVRGTSSQAFLEYLRSEEILDIESLESYIFRLVDSNIRHTRINHITLLHAFRSAGCTFAEPYVKVLQCLAGDRSTAESAIYVGITFIFTLWKMSELSDHDKFEQTLRVLETLCLNREVGIVLSKVTHLARLVIDKVKNPYAAYGFVQTLKVIEKFCELYDLKRNTVKLY